MNPIPEPIIDLQDVAKCYHVYRKPQDRLKQALYPRLLRLLRMDHARAYHEEFWALRDISLQIKRGETVGIIGRNGSGKSTLLQIICGTLASSAGQVNVNGRIAALLELGAGFNPEFSGRENVFLNGSLLGLSRQQIEARFDSIAAFADIGTFIDQPVKTYSSGMYVRLAFAVIAHVDADILVIDEALAVGDAFFTQKCMRFLREFMNQGTVLFVSHDTGAVLNLCQRAIWLDKGQVRMEGDPKMVAETYLQAFYSEQQGDIASASSKPKSSTPAASQEPIVDQRLAFLNQTPLRNDIEIFQFQKPERDFGKGEALIQRVSLLDANNAAIGWLVGGEVVTLEVEVAAQSSICNPIVGFSIKDRLGQTLFGDNTYLASQTAALFVAQAGENFAARFCFQMPILPAGDYSIDVAVAEGTQADHVQHHWIHDAMVFRSHSSSVSTGLVGIPMLETSLSIRN